MASLRMNQAFDAQMMTSIIKVEFIGARYDEQNDWQEGQEVKSTIKGVIRPAKTGESVELENGGVRYSDWLKLHITDLYSLKMGDKIEWKGTRYNILSLTNQQEFGFQKAVIEKSEKQ